MGEVRWTPEQQTVIRLRNCNILVSAAAGSGKTAVLVERIMSRLMEENPLNIDEFVIVTFTAAAAAEMRERIGRAIDSAVAQNPDNKHLAKQVALLHHAHISTIHSFCGYIIQNYFHRIGLDPSYRLMTDGESRLLQKDAMSQILEEEYENPTDEFIDLIECYKFDRSDYELEAYIRQLYSCAMSEPWPEQYLMKILEQLSFDSSEKFMESNVIKCMLIYVKSVIKDLGDFLEELLQITQEKDGPGWYFERLQKDLEICKKVEQASDYEQMRQTFDNMDFGIMSRKKSDGESPEKREFVKNQRNRVKAYLKKLQTEFFELNGEEEYKNYCLMSGKLKELVRLTLCFAERFTNLKRERGLADFNDLEQLTLQILYTQDEEGNRIVTEAAAELAGQFREIMIDEYQDSNLVQDMILRSISRESRGEPNIFMVGDVKQSIYRFRSARPELFMEKLECYSVSEGQYRRVDLHKNFRSREVILDSANRIFEKMMHRDLGGVEYDQAAALYPGRRFAGTSDTEEKTEVLIVHGEDVSTELEAEMVANRILELTDNETGLLIENGEGGLRRAQLRDVAVLARSVKRILKPFEKVFRAKGIPVIAKRKSGFYQTREISMMVNMFRIIDNPYQDIPLASVLRSPMFSFTDEELALIKGDGKRKHFYEYVINYTGNCDLQQKIEKFLHILEDLRKKLSYARVVDIINSIYEETDIFDYILTLPDSARRKANLEYLMKEAIEFDATTYRGLFQFVRYLERLEETESDIGEADSLEDSEQAVQFVTMHGSKGLEYPICFVADMGSRMNVGQEKNWLQIHPKLGIASEAIDNGQRIRQNTLFQKYLQTANRLEDLGEELRNFYVAVTRAKEKLIFSGADKGFEKHCEEWERYRFSYFERMNSTTYLDMLMPIILQDTSEVFQLSCYEKEDLLGGELAEQIAEAFSRERLYKFDTDICYDSETERCLRRMEQFIYNWQGGDLPVKVSVSDLKKKSMEDTETPEFHILSEGVAENEAPIPKFLSSENLERQKCQGAVFGTLIHQVMAGIDFTAISEEKDIERQLTEMEKSGKIEAGQRQLVPTRKLYHFFNSELGNQMTDAMAQGKLYREQPFVLGVQAKEVFVEQESEQTVLVQGIIDSFYESTDGIVLIDYKTDRLQDGQEELLRKRYLVQMEFYRKALERITGRKVIQGYLYSFSLSKSISCFDMKG